MFDLSKSGENDSLAANFLAVDREPAVQRQTVVLAVCFSLIVAAVAALGASASYRAVTRGTDVFSEVGNLPLVADVRNLVFGETAALAAKKDDDRMNVLILGIGGEGHDGSLLTDTIIYASVDLKEKRVGMVSIPRDLAYPLGNGRFEKINSLHAYAEQDHPGEGAKLTGEAMSELLDTRIDHVVRIDFRGFVRLVDALGGIDVTVERSFTDPQYPTEDEKWTTVSFKKGHQRMDGASALVFVRSRHGSNGEGSDFARSRRQQIVISALRDRMLSLNTLGDPRKLSAAYAAVNSHLQTDLNVWDLAKLAPLASEFTLDRITMHVLTDAPEGELAPANVGGAFMLFPRKPDWSEIREIVKNPFMTKEERFAKEQPAETTRIELKNGTTRTGFASQVAAKLEKTGFYEVAAFGNATRRGYERSVIYDLTGGAKPAELAKLRNLLGADVSLNKPVSSSSTGELVRYVLGSSSNKERIFAPQTDFVIILGEASYAYVDAIAGQ